MKLAFLAIAAAVLTFGFSVTTKAEESKPTTPVAVPQPEAKKEVLTKNEAEKDKQASGKETAPVATGQTK